MITQFEGFILLMVFAIFMIGLVLIKSKQEKHLDGFLVADRNVSVLRGSMSIAISWVWAPAIFVCSMQAYNFGLPGLFWFTLPNIVCFFVFAPIAIRLRKKLPKGYTLPQYIHKKYRGSKTAHIIFTSSFVLTMIFAIISNAYAGGTLLNALTGINTNIAIMSIALIALTYSLISGLKASIITDVVQMMLVFILAIVIVPWVVSITGFDAIYDNIGGVDGKHPKLFDPHIAFIMGIPMTITLLTGPVCDQMFFQRAFAVKQENIVKTFVWGGIIFGFVPIILSVLGFVGAELASSGAITVDNPEMVGPYVIAHLLPKSALFAFTFMAFAGLCSTLDSSLCAISSLFSIDIFKRYVDPKVTDKKLLWVSRKFMVIFCIIGTSIALLKPNMLWTFMIYGSVTAAVFFPIIFSLFWDRLTGRGISAAIFTSIVLGLPFSIYANINNQENLIVYSSLFTILTSLLICVINGLMNKKTG